jgi:hypothetical protein
VTPKSTRFGDAIVSNRTVSVFAMGGDKWVACFSCLLMDSGRELQEHVGFLVRHSACAGELVVSCEVEQNLMELRSQLVLPEVKSVDLDDFLLQLADVRKRQREKVASRQQMQKARIVRGYSMIGNTKKGLLPPPRRPAVTRWEYLRSNNWVANLSENQRQAVLRQFYSLSSHFDAKDCHVLPAAVKLKVMNQERKIGTHNPLSIATFLAFGYPLREVDVERSCGEPGCVNPIHLIDPKGQPKASAQEEIVSALLNNLRSYGTLGCTFEAWDSKPIAIRSADRGGHGGEMVAAKLLIAYIATGKILDVDTSDYQWIVRTCPTLGCSTPSHLSWTRASKSSWQTAFEDPEDHLASMMAEVVELLGDLNISLNQCLTLDEAQLARVRHRFRSKWSFEWSGYRVQTPISHDGELDASFIFRSIFLAVRGWSVSPYFKYVREQRAYRCPKSKNCFNPYHFDSQILFLENEYPSRSVYQFAWQEKLLLSSASQELLQGISSNHRIVGTL